MLSALFISVSYTHLRRAIRRRDRQRTFSRLRLRTLVHLSLIHISQTSGSGQALDLLAAGNENGSCAQKADAVDDLCAETRNVGFYADLCANIRPQMCIRDRSGTDDRSVQGNG